MEPRTGTGEHAPQVPQPEQWAPPSMPEHAPGFPEQHEKTRPILEQPQQARRVEMQSQPPAVGVSLPAPHSGDGILGQSVASDDAPLVAADEDIIEKEWVDKAKQIISETKDDPYIREQRIKKLQVEYIRKRYGREIGETVD